MRFSISMLKGPVGGKQEHSSKASVVHSSSHSKPGMQQRANVPHTNASHSESAHPDVSWTMQQSPSPTGDSNRVKE